MASTDFQKSTIVRIQQATLATAFNAAERLSPRLGGRLAERLWFTLPPGPRRHHDPDGGTPFVVRSGSVDVRGTTWGSGPVVYLVHGWGGRGHQLAGFVEPLVHTGHQVVAFDAPSHGDSAPGPSGPGRSTVLELGQALDAVAAKFGPARALLAHSLGSMAGLLARRHGWLGVDRLVLVAPIVDIEPVLDVFTTPLRIGPRTRRDLRRRIAARTGMSLDDFTADQLMVEPVPTLVLHDRTDRQAPYTASVALAAARDEVSLVSTSGLGHQRILRDPAVVAAAVAHIVDEPGAAAAGLAS
ncbi:MAG: alpha/beta fold hydrolase [Nocardioidaceae bacterium]